MAAVDHIHWLVINMSIDKPDMHSWPWNWHGEVIIKYSGVGCSILVKKKWVIYIDSGNATKSLI